MKRLSLCILIVLTIGFIGYISVLKYNNFNDDEINQFENITKSSSLALVLIDEEGNEAETDSFPSSDEYYLNFAKSYCENGSLIGWDNENNMVKITADKKDGCKLYFNKGTGVINLKEDVLKNNTLLQKPSSQTSYISTTSPIIFSAKDNLGTSYYFRGAPTNNYVHFAGYYWRIIRINGDGTIRIVFVGSNPNISGSITGLSAGRYNFKTDGAKYVGYTFDVNDSDTTQTDSFIKHNIDLWYESKLKDNYSKYIADSIFCNDREIYSNESETAIYYGSFNRFNTSTEYNPDLICAREQDKYTVSKENGNGLLKYPIGIITADEVMMAGGRTTAINTAFYLSNVNIWTLTPAYYSETDSKATVWTSNNGHLLPVEVTSEDSNLLPVINLRADLLFTGNGKAGNPYKVAGFE